ncbi:alpha-sialidase [[Actinomadura] parvosata subsp. kistnae]|uniref:exo-alpha-sialidase n=1 Tax=[Actinomadura] parvosata subsp. kistnae TaxID=1909395 RepID=A0A1V0AD12_9ACTN|nr:sialidase family protein [Nonomuraea sp. ATCC 55076]AQZ68111.1 alpha-sialidase [Nonomuraea sp. ATCC 55076]
MADDYPTSVPFRQATDGYHTFRIPAAVVTRAGTVLAFAEGRRGSASDSGHIDLVLKRSSDGGRTWGGLQVVATEPQRGTAGNPAPVVLDDGRILLVFVRQGPSATEEKIRRGQVPAAAGRRVFAQVSEDDGATWSAPREITGSVKKPEWRWYATTPGHAVQLRQGEHAGRVVVPANHSLPPSGQDNGTEGKYNGGHALLSDDGGQTWRIGYVDDNPDGYVNVNETTATELPGGRLYLNTRTDSTAPGTRADACSADGGQTLELPFRPQAGLAGPVVEGSVLWCDEPEVLLFSGPAAPDARALMTVRASHDHGVTWRVAHTVSGLPAAYSDLVRVDGETVGLLFETGNFGPYESIAFRRIPVAELAAR